MGNASRIRSFGYRDTDELEVVGEEVSFADEAYERRVRWQRKYGSPTPGAALSALVGIMYDLPILNKNCN